MYIHPAFGIGTERAVALLRERGFGLFIVEAPDGPAAVHVPFLLNQCGKEPFRLEFHVARANPIHERIGTGCRALFVCQGPDAYISPDWYTVPDQVPTWTYWAVHLTGTANVMPQSEHLAHVERLSAEFERRLAPKPPWTSAKMSPRKREAMLRAIVAVRLEVEGIEAQVKVSQQKGETERRGAIEGLTERGDAASIAIAELIRGTLA